MDENRKLDVAQLAAQAWATENAHGWGEDNFGSDVAKVFKDAYKALGDKQEEPTMSQLSSAEAYAAYMRVVNKESQSLGDHIPKAQDGPQWVEIPVKNGVYFVESEFVGHPSEWVYVVDSYVFRCISGEVDTIADSGIKRFYGPMKAPA